MSAGPFKGSNKDDGDVVLVVYVTLRVLQLPANIVFSGCTEVAYRFVNL